MLIPSVLKVLHLRNASLSRRVNANSQPLICSNVLSTKLIKKGEC